MPCEKGKGKREKKKKKKKKVLSEIFSKCAQKDHLFPFQPVGSCFDNYSLNYWYKHDKNNSNIVVLDEHRSSNCFPYRETRTNCFNMSTAEPVTHKVKPEKPDEEAFNANLKKVQKEHSDLMEKLVCFPFFIHETAKECPCFLHQFMKKVFHGS